MPMSAELETLEHLTLAVDFADRRRLERWADFAHAVGGVALKFGTTAATAPGMSWEICSEIAGERGLNWDADLKLHDNGDTELNTVKNFAAYNNKPRGVTMFIESGPEALVAVKQILDKKRIELYGVTVPSGLDSVDCERIYGNRRNPQVMKLAKQAVKAGLLWVVTSPKEVPTLKVHNTTKHLKNYVPGSRSKGVPAYDQKNIVTPGEAITYGADILVIGRQITRSRRPKSDFSRLFDEVGSALESNKLKETG